MIFDGLVKNVNNKVLKFLMYPRQYTQRARIAQSLALPPVADEPASPMRDVSQGEGINLSGDDAPIKGRRLDEEDVATERVCSDTEEIRLDEVAAKKVSDDTEEMATVLITMDA
nr:hypothetical protein [Tanacetum cinerariifolium]